MVNLYCVGELKCVVGINPGYFIKMDMKVRAKYRLSIDR